MDGADRLRTLVKARGAAEPFNKFWHYFPDTDRPGFAARDRYPRHVEFFAEGKDTMCRLAMAGLGVGKTEGMGGYEMTCHLTGLYPGWWTGMRYDRPIDVWIAGDTKETTRDIQQTKLFGRPGQEGTGLIPKHLIDFDAIKRRPNSNGAIDTFAIKHVGGWKNVGGFKAYDQGVDSFFGTEKDVLWGDELIPLPIFSQFVARTRNREGARIMLTFTPMAGRTDTVRLFLEEEDSSRKVIYCGWDDAPHLTAEWKAAQLANTAPYLRDTVSLGQPARGSGAVFPVSESRIAIDPFPIPSHFRRAFGFDGKFKATAFAFMAYDKDSDVIYITGEYKDGGVDLSVHASRVKLRLMGMKQVSMPGVGDYSGEDVSSGKKILDLYKAQGLRIRPATKKEKDARVQEMLTRMETDRFKVFRSCSQWFQEFRNYSYHHETGKIIKVNDDLIDASLYVCHDGPRIAEAPRDLSTRHRMEEQTFGLYSTE
jgi:phage terminase large subunit-like protein